MVWWYCLPAHKCIRRTTLLHYDSDEDIVCGKISMHALWKDNTTQCSMDDGTSRFGSSSSQSHLQGISKIVTHAQNVTLPSCCGLGKGCANVIRWAIEEFILVLNGIICYFETFNISSLMKKNQVWAKRQSGWKNQESVAPGKKQKLSQRWGPSEWHALLRIRLVKWQCPEATSNGNDRQ